MQSRRQGWGYWREGAAWHRWILWVLSWLSMVQLVTAQDVPLSNLRTFTYRPDSVIIQLDSLTVVPGSVFVTTPSGKRIDSTAYRMEGNTLTWQTLPADSVVLTYRVLPFALDAPATLLDTTLLQPIPEGIALGRRYTVGAEDDPLVDLGGLDYNGSFSRGISVGNRQDLVLNSSFNLQMAGELGDGIEVSAAITDENLPIQPEGTTQQLREFDKVFIQLRKDRSILTAGDYELTRPDGYFLNYFKKLEGITFQTGGDVGAAGAWDTRVGLAISRGIFRRQNITPAEGNQGPYKLRGANDERFIIVLSGTERVFIDGQPQVRGLEGDYIVDYNQGEVTFMPRRLITKDSRIVVEFEYADQRYLRSLYVADTRYRSNRLDLHVNLYSQQDSRTATGDLPLSDTEKQLLAEAGDNVEETLVSTVARLEDPDPQRVTYALVDTVLFDCGGRDTAIQLLRFSTDPANRYTARFTFVGSGQGNYVLDREQAANERVFRWSPPDPLTCTPTGDYLAATPLKAPEQQRMLTVGGGYRLGRATQVKGEWALSQFDQNRFSRLDKADDSDWAGWVALEHDFWLGPDTSGWVVHTEFNHERRQTNFTPVNPYRGPDFLRDWNLADVLGQGDTEAAAERLSGAEVRLQRRDWGQLGYRLSQFQRADRYDGLRQTANLSYRRGMWEARGQADYLRTDETEQTSRLWRPQLLISHRLKALGGFRVGGEFAAEQSERLLRISQEFAANSYAFDRLRFFIENPDTARYDLSLQYNQRNDFRARGAELPLSAQAREAQVNGQWRGSKVVQVGGTFTWRELNVVDTLLSTQTSGETFLGQLNLNLNLIQGVLRTQTNYTIGSGQEPRVEYTYLFVGPGQGQYIWLDSLYNNDGKIQPNEMEISPFPDIADYIRVSVITDDFVRTDNATLNQSIALATPRAWKRETGWKNTLSRFGLQSTLTVNRKTRASDLVERWNPLQLDLPDTALVSLSSTQRHVLNFNRSNPRFDLQLEEDDSRRRTILTTGYESSRRREYRMRLRYKLNDALIGRAALGRSLRVNDSEFFNNKDYQLRGISVAPELIWQPGQDWRFTFSYAFQDEQNQSESAERNRQHALDWEGSFRQRLRGSLRYVDVAFTGDPRSPVSFVLLNGLQPGRNFLWELILTQPLSRGLQLTLNYEGRKTGDSPIVHVGRAQVTALF